MHALFLLNCIGKVFFGAPAPYSLKQITKIVIRNKKENKSDEYSEKQNKALVEKAGKIFSVVPYSQLV
jgi:hypothetical protein